MHGMLKFGDRDTAPTRRPRPTTACLSCRDRRVKCDRTQPACSICTKRNIVCKYTNTLPSSTKTRGQHVTAKIGPQVSEHILNVETDPSTTKRDKADVEPVTGDLAGDTLSILANADETTNEDINIVRDAELPDVSLRISSIPADRLRSITQSFPDQRLCDIYFQTFLTNVHPMVPICDVPELRERYSELWAMPRSETSADTLALILASIYCGMISSSVLEDIELSSSLFSAYQDLMQSVNYPADVSSWTLTMLQSNLLVNTCRASQIEPLSSFGFLPQTIRIAQSLRLHVDKSDSDHFQQHLKRPIWWHLAYLDVEASILSGLPKLIHEEDYSTKMPCGLSNGPASGKSEESVISDLTQRSAMRVAMQARWQWTLIMRTWRKHVPTNDEISDFHHIIRGLLAIIPDVQETQWARTYIELQIDRAICSAARGFLGSSSLTRIDCHHDVLRSSRSFLRNFVRLSSISAQNGLQWFVPGFVHPLQAMMILLLHLTMCNSLDLEMALDSRLLLDQTFHLVGNRVSQGRLVAADAISKSKGRSEKASIVHCLLSKLRLRVWRRAGWEVLDGFGLYFCPLSDWSATIPRSRSAADFEFDRQGDTMVKGQPIVAEFNNGMNVESFSEFDWEEWGSMVEQYLQPGVVD